MRWWAVLADWGSEHCYECGGSPGRTWEVVAADSAELAVICAGLEPEIYERDRDVWVFELASRPAPQMKKPRAWNRHRLPRPSHELWKILEAPKPQYEMEES